MTRRILLLALPFALLVAACGADDGQSAATTTAAPSTTAESPTTTEGSGGGVGALSCGEKAALFTTRGSANADLPDPQAAGTCDGDAVVVTANGIPDFTYIETSPGDPTETTLEFTLPASPAEADETTDVPRLGSAAVAVDGIPIYGPTEGQGGDVESLPEALSDCGSHNGPTGFHFHQFGTSDATDCLYTPAEVEAEPRLFGFALDGYPIYSGNGQYTSSWSLTDESLFASDTWSAHTYTEGSGDLDECNGRTDEDGNYAYYTTDGFPYVLGCYHGVVDLDAAGGGIGELDTTGGPPA